MRPNRMRPTRAAAARRGTRPREARRKGSRRSAMRRTGAQGPVRGGLVLLRRAPLRSAPLGTLASTRRIALGPKSPRGGPVPPQRRTHRTWGAQRRTSPTTLPSGAVRHSPGRAPLSTGSLPRPRHATGSLPRPRTVRRDGRGGEASAALLEVFWGKFRIPFWKSKIRKACSILRKF